MLTLFGIKPRNEEIREQFTYFLLPPINDGVY